MRTPYSLSSDQHAHDWSQFSNIGADGVNSRLRLILNELVRQAEMTKARGWTKMRLGGDLFHVRGKITPSVMNPTIDTFKHICSMGIEVEAIAGNHDLEDIYATKLGNAMQALDEIPGFTAITEPTMVDNVVMIPWIQDLDHLRAEMRRLHGVGAKVSDLDLIIHAPVNGVIKGIPDHGLEADELKALGYNRVLSGHYHNHVDFGDGVFSIGATTHQTWSDPGTKAGFMMIADANTTEFIESQAPKFVNVDHGVTVSDATMPGIFGNYVRLRLQDEEEGIIKATRASVENAGALGIVDHSSKKRPTVRGVANVKAGTTLEAAITSFTRDHLNTTLDRDRIATMALDVLRNTVSA
jgi:heme-degrading monooxygenase HmoA